MSFKSFGSGAPNPIGVIKSLAGVRDDGLPHPSARFQRFRRSEYDGRPFYQWWYFVVKDLVDDRYFAFHLNPVDTVQNHSRRGVYAMFSMVERSAKTRFHTYERFAYESLTAGDEGLDVSVYGGESFFELEAPEQCDEIRVRGELASPSLNWFHDGTFDGTDIDQTLTVKWDLQIHRLFGWYGEDDLEEQMVRDGLTMWNTYAHTAEVEGSLTIGGTTFEVGRTSRFRAYCDMNWGSEFLHGTPPEAYPWGWFYAGRPLGQGGLEGTLDSEFAIIAGTGRSEDTVLQGWNRHLGVDLAFEGKFADIELGGGRRVGAREVEFFRRVYRGGDGEWYAGDGIPVLQRASDGGRLEQFKVYRDRWIDYRDKFGLARVPLSQLVRIRTSTLEISLSFSMVEADCNRLLFPQENGIFSDIEALGAVCHVLVLHRDRPGGRHSSHQLKVLEDFSTNDAGLEFGYLAPGRV